MIPHSIYTKNCCDAGKKKQRDDEKKEKNVEPFGYFCEGVERRKSDYD